MPDMKQINGRDNTGTHGNTPIEKFLGRNLYSSKYFTTNFEEYSKRLKTMDSYDLYRHCLEVTGEARKSTREKLIAKLEKHFVSYQKLQDQIFENHKNKPVREKKETQTKEAQDILDLTL